MEILCAFNYYPKFLVATIIGLRVVFLFCPYAASGKVPQGSSGVNHITSLVSGACPKADC